MLRKKLAEKKGAMLTVVILGVAVIVVALIIAIPLISDANEAAKAKLDTDHEHTAEDSALMRWFSTGEFTAVYDAEQKVFLDDLSVRDMTPYGQSKEHKDMVIQVHADAAGEITMEWIDPKLYKRKFTTESSGEE